jgi:hypothetical protein
MKRTIFVLIALNAMFVSESYANPIDFEGIKLGQDQASLTKKYKSFLSEKTQYDSYDYAIHNCGIEIYNLHIDGYSNIVIKLYDGEVQAIDAEKKFSPITPIHLANRFVDKYGHPSGMDCYVNGETSNCDERAQSVYVSYGNLSDRSKIGGYYSYIEITKSYFRFSIQGAVDYLYERKKACISKAVAEFERNRSNSISLPK